MGLCDNCRKSSSSDHQPSSNDDKKSKKQLRKEQKERQRQIAVEEEDLMFSRDHKSNRLNNTLKRLGTIISLSSFSDSRRNTKADINLYKQSSMTSMSGVNSNKNSQMNEEASTEDGKLSSDSNLHPTTQKSTDSKKSSAEGYENVLSMNVGVLKEDTNN